MYRQGFVYGRYHGNHVINGNSFAMDMLESSVLLTSRSPTLHQTVPLYRKSHQHDTSGTGCRSPSRFEDSYFQGQHNIGSSCDENGSKDKTFQRRPTAIDSSTLFRTFYSAHEVNVDRCGVVTSGVNHVEGGWPRDITYTDLEQTIRFRKKTEKDVDYSQITVRLAEVVEHGVKQNNTLKFFQRIYDTSGCVKPGHLGRSRAVKLLRMLRDPLARSTPVSSLSWSSTRRLATAYCNLKPEQVALESTKQAFVWDIGSFVQPDVTLEAPCNVASIEFNPKDPCCLIGGCSNGQLVFWDVRSQASASIYSMSEEGHQQCVRSILFLNSKTGTEFFSASVEGMICWWDIRKMSKPLDMLMVDGHRQCPDGVTQPTGATFLEFEPTMSTKFMVGTEVGSVFLCNSKAKSMQEKLAGMFVAHLGPVGALQRNPVFPKNFLTVGDWTSKIWSEDVRESPILVASHGTVQTTAACWNTMRPSVFFTTTDDGHLHVWDLLFDCSCPVESLKVFDTPLCSIRLQDNGNMLACGSSDGNVVLMLLEDEYMVLSREEKLLLANTFERETHREKILEARRREQKLCDRSDLMDTKNKVHVSALLDAAVADAETNFLNRLNAKS